MINVLSTMQGNNYQISQSVDELESLIQELDGPEITAATHAMSQINIGSDDEGEEIKNQESDQSEYTEDSSSSYQEPDPVLATVGVPDDPSTQGYDVAYICLSDADRYVADDYLMEPHLWVDVLEHIETLHPGEHVSPIVMNAWLLHCWSKLNRPYPRYIPMEYMNRRQVVTVHEIQEFQKYFHVKSHQKQDLIGFMHVSGNHYFCILYIASLNNIQVLGKEMDVEGTEAGNWEEWNGSIVWKNLCLLHDWSYTLSITIDKRNWIQESFESGPTICQVMEHIWTNGVTWDVTGLWKKPHIPCGHVTRIRMGNDVYQMVKTSFEALQQLSRNELDVYFRSHGKDESILSEVSIVERMLKDDSQASVAVQSCVKKNTDAMDTCEGCAANLPKLPKHRTMKQLLDRYPTLQGARRLLATPGNLNPDEQESSAGEEEPNPPGMQLNPQRRHRATKDIAQTTIDRFPRPIAAPHIDSLKHLTGLYNPFNWNYDDYQDGPTMDALAPISDTVIQFASKSLAYIAGKLLDIPWRLFRDYGYRLLPHSFQMFHLHHPVMVKEHLMVIDLHASPASSPCHNITQIELHQSPSIISLHETRHGEGEFTASPASSPCHDAAQIELHPSTSIIPPHNTVQTRWGEAEITDIVSMGASEMIQLSKQVSNNDIFVTGKTADGQFINVNLQQDSVTPEKIIYAIDIDSVIWITRTPRFSLAVELYISPVFRNKAPILKDNHVKVELLYPPVEQGQREEWWTRSFSLSRIPHVLLGKIGKANICLFLPRMTHQDPYTHRWANVVPPEVQTQLWEKIVIKALRRVLGNVGLAYIGENQAHISFKSSDQARMPKTHPVRKSHFVKMVEEMQDIVSNFSSQIYNDLTKFKIQDDAEGDLAQFGSMFFVLEIKGCKMVSQAETNDAGLLNGCLGDALNNLKEENPSLDWDYMEDRKLGELLYDVGITIQPKGIVPTVGLWRLDNLEALYGAAGYLRGNIHHLNTLLLYGGLQAEMPRSRSERTHILYRQSYNLAYEALRKANNQRELFKLQDVYQLNRKFRNEYKSVMEIYGDHAKKQSYGVRDEYRVGGAAMINFMEHVDQMVSQEM